MLVLTAEVFTVSLSVFTAEGFPVMVLCRLNTAFLSVIAVTSV